MGNDRVTLDDLRIRLGVTPDAVPVDRLATLADLREVLLDLGAIPIGTSLLLRADVLEETE